MHDIEREAVLPPVEEVCKPLPAAARRALAEAEQRRLAIAQQVRARELQGPEGPEPTRYGDWERKGIATDF